MEDRAGALSKIAALAREHGITAAEIAAVLDEAPVEKAADRNHGVLVRVLGFLGGIFVFAGVWVFIALQWDDMGAAARVVVTLGSGLAAFALALAAARDPRFTNAATPLWLAAAVLQPTGLLVVFDEFGSGGDWRLASLATAGTMAVQYVLTFGALRRSALLCLALMFATLFSWTALDLLDLDGGVTAVLLGASMLLAAAGVDRTAHTTISPPWYLVGGTAFLGGLFDLVRQTPVEIVFVATAAGGVYLSVVLRSRSLLAVSTLAILAYTGWFTSEHFADSIGWPLALVAFGLLMIALSAVAFRIDRDYLRHAPRPQRAR